MTPTPKKPKKLSIEKFTGKGKRYNLYPKLAKKIAQARKEKRLYSSGEVKKLLTN